jgi:hypothetical protein
MEGQRRLSGRMGRALIRVFPHVEGMEGLTFDSTGRLFYSPIPGPCSQPGLCMHNLAHCCVEGSVGYQLKKVRELG